MNNILIGVINFLVPKTFFSKGSDFLEYKITENENFRKSWLYCTIFAILTYITHYHFIDLALEKSPVKTWFIYRYGLAALSLFNLILYFKWKNFGSKLYKILPLLTMFLICYFQSRSNVWEPKTPFTYTFLFIAFTSYILKLTGIEFLIFSISTLYFCIINLKASGVNNQAILSASILTFFFGLLLSSIKYFQVKIFISNKKLLFEQRKNIKQNIEFMEKLKSFLPRQIVNRFERKIQNKAPIHIAIEEVLKPRKQVITCLSCDIRSFTQKTKKDLSYITQSVLPLTWRETEIVESNRGIPRKIGDLLFSYFDENDTKSNILNCFTAAIEIALSEKEYNQENQKESVSKNIILSTGEAIVGNIGGQNSAIEITALGSPVNFLNRLESVIKHKKISSQLAYDQLILSDQFYEILSNYFANLNGLKFDLRTYNLQIKDFEEVRYFYTVKADKKFIQNISSDLKKYAA